MSYHIFINLAGLLNGYHAMKIGIGIQSNELMDRVWNFFNTYKFNIRCVFEGKFWKHCLFYKLNCKLCGDFYTGNTQQTLKKIMDGQFYGVQLILKKKKSNSFAAHYE